MFKWLFGSENDITISISLERNKKFSYKAKTNNEMKMNDMALMNNGSDYLFDVTFLGEQNGFYIFEWNTTYRQMFQGMEYLSEHFDLLHHILSIKDHLILEVGKNGVIKNVLNKEELNNKWNTLKNDVLNNPELIPITDTHRDQFINDGDNEFSKNFPLQETLNGDQLFSTFFHQFAMLDNKYGNDVIRRLDKKSLFLQWKNEPLIIPLIQTSNWRKDDNSYRFLISESVDNSRLPKGKIRDVLLSLEMTDTELRSYLFENQIDYRIDSETFSIIEVKSQLFEKINSNIEMNYECQIKQVYE